MYLRKLTIANYRNYIKSRINFNRHLNIIIGGNGKGKTNILESIFVLSTTTSHRTSLNSELIKNGEIAFNIKAEINDSESILNIEVRYDRTMGFRAKMNGNKIKRSELIEKFPVVFFTPEDIEVIKGAPGELRRMININISQINPKYITMLIRYRKILKERNAYLKNINNKEELSIRNTNLKIWTESLLKESEEITKVRRKFIEKINEAIKLESKRMDLSEKFEIKYNPTKFKNNISLMKDLRYGCTTWGIHRDIFTFYKDEFNLKICGSRGEIRLAALIYRMALWKLLKDFKNKAPLVLLDDIFSELDIDKRKKIESSLKETQAIITATEIPDEIYSKANVIKL